MFVLKSCKTVHRQLVLVVGLGESEVTAVVDAGVVGAGFVDNAGPARELAVRLVDAMNQLVPPVGVAMVESAPPQAEAVEKRGRK